MSQDHDPAFVRPDPVAGIEADGDYAKLYVASHAVERDNCDYRIGYAAYLLLDRILQEGYALLDVGCGTGGYHRLLTRAGRIVGLDFSSEMIAAANQLKAKLGWANVEYLALRFEDYRAEKVFDAVSLIGIFGWYVPWVGHESILVQVANMLPVGGVACLSYVPPRSLVDHAKAAVFPKRTVVIRSNVFSRMLHSAGFSVLLELQLPHTTVVFAKKGRTANDD